MTELLTAAQMRAIEQAAITSGEVTGLELMERAGHGVVGAVFREWPEFAKTSHHAMVLCGPGNNGGDGFVIARLLREWGWDVAVFLYGDAGKLPPDALINYERWRTLGEVQPYDALENPPNSFGSHLIVDAMFGTGLTRPLDIVPEATLPERDLRESDPRAMVVSVDIVSGICADSGRVLGSSDEERAFWADLTVTFHRAKAGHYLAQGAMLSGKVVVHDIGIGSETPSFQLGGDDEGGSILDLPRRRSDTETTSAVRLVGPPHGVSKALGHKYSHGHALILSGSTGRGGAARLAARGALRVGAGLVTIGCPPEALAENAARLDAIMLRALTDGRALTEVLKDRRINALCLGPGMGVDAHGVDLVGAALATELPTVLDADALSVLFFDEADALFGKLHGNCVLTPHAGEFARLFPDISERLNASATKGPAYSKVDATREAAKRAGCVVLFKGPDTVIAAPDGSCSINSAAYDRQAPWLATAGSGDVLAGFITGLLARGLTALQASKTAAWLHVECARKFGPGLIAEDLPEQLPKVFRDLDG